MSVLCTPACLSLWASLRAGTGCCTGGPPLLRCHNSYMRAVIPPPLSHLELPPSAAHWDYFFHKDGISNGGNRYATVLMYLADTEEGGETVFPNIPAPGGVNEGFSDCAKWVAPAGFAALRRLCRGSGWGTSWAGRWGEVGSGQRKRELGLGPCSHSKLCCAAGTDTQATTPTARRYHLAAKPRKVDAILFHSIKTTGELERKSLHTACPVIKGIKWSAAKWWVG